MDNKPKWLSLTERNDAYYEEQEAKASLDQYVEEHGPEVQAMLKEYGKKDRTMVMSSWGEDNICRRKFNFYLMRTGEITCFNRDLSKNQSIKDVSRFNIQDYLEGLGFTDLQRDNCLSMYRIDNNQRQWWIRFYGIKMQVSTKLVFDVHINVIYQAFIPSSPTEMNALLELLKIKLQG